jgi:hypothetical protein
MAVVIDGTNGVSSPDYEVDGVTGQLYPIVSGTAQATTSGTFKDFTGIPSWAKRITVMLSGVSTNGTSNLLVRIGAGSIQTTGYDSTASVGTAAGTFQSSTVGFILTYPNQGANSVFKGIVTLVNLGSNIWVQSGAISDSVFQLYNNGSSGSVTLSGALDRVRITTVNGTDTFDAGTINILYE